MKKKCAVFTIVKNENYFLPIWLKHYKKYFNNSDIYVLDHQSNDGSTNNLDVNVIRIDYKLAFDHHWLVQTVQQQQTKLLEEYESVLFAEVDEIIYTVNEPLNIIIDKFLNDEKVHVQTCTNRELVQNLEMELPLNNYDLILEKRNYWIVDLLYNKTLLSKVPLNWSLGFHYSNNYPTNYTYDLRMLHLHRFDFEMMYKRNIHRLIGTEIKNDGANGFQNKLTEREDLMNFFLSYTSTLELIPEEHKNILKHL